MDRNLEKSVVVNTSASLKGAEMYAVGMDGVKTASKGDLVYGIVSRGRPQNEASEVIVHGETSAYVDGSGDSVSKEDPLTGGSNGKMVKATIGGHVIRAYAKEAVSADTIASVMLT